MGNKTAAGQSTAAGLFIFDAMVLTSLLLCGCKMRAQLMLMLYSLPFFVGEGCDLSPNEMSVFDHVNQWVADCKVAYIGG